MTEEIRPGIHRIVVPLPGNPLKELTPTSSPRKNAYDTAARMTWSIRARSWKSSQSCSAGSPPARR